MPTFALALDTMTRLRANLKDSQGRSLSWDTPTGRHFLEVSRQVEVGIAGAVYRELPGTQSPDGSTFRVQKVDRWAINEQGFVTAGPLAVKRAAGDRGSPHLVVRKVVRRAARP